MAGLIQGDSCGDRELVLRSATCLAARTFSAEIGVIHLDLSSQQIALLPLGHRPQGLVVQQPGRVVVDAEVAAELQQGDPVFSLANHIESKEPGGQRQLGRLHDRSGCEGGLITAVSALITLEPPAADEATIMAIATWANGTHQASETSPEQPNIAPR